MGPSVKFVLPIIDAFPNKKMGVIFGVAKKDTTGGGSEGVAFFGRNFSRLSFLNNSLRCSRKKTLFFQKWSTWKWREEEYKSPNHMNAFLGRREKVYFYEIDSEERQFLKLKLDSLRSLCS